MSKNRLFNIPGSHPAMAARLMLDRKGVSYSRIDLLPIISKGVVRAAGFPGKTVPALKINGEKVQGTRAIAEHLDRIYPDDLLIPADPERRDKVLEIEAWADQGIQALTRRLLWASLKIDTRAIGTFAEGAKIGVPIAVAERTAAPIIYASARFNEADDANVQADLRELPATLGRIRGWLDAGDLSAENPTVADYQVATSLGLLMALDDIRPAIEQAGLSDYVTAVVPEYPGHIQPVLPDAWLEPLRTAPAAS